MCSDEGAEGMRDLQAKRQDNPGREPGGMIRTGWRWENTARASGTALLQAGVRRRQKEAADTNTTTTQNRNSRPD